MKPAFLWNVIFRGQTGHVGPTPMDRRKNALVGAAKFMGAVNDIGWKFAPIGKTTVSRIRVWPNKNGIIPSYAEVTLDMRHQDPDQSAQMYLETTEALKRCAQEASVDFEVQAEWSFGGDIRFDPDCIAGIRNAAKVLGVPTMDIYSQAGHDAYVVSYGTPTAMIFSPCVEGISHNQAENVIPEQTWPSVNVLLHAVLARAER
ncbi:MAG: M20/M25/M40 family metallo-hydrolase [Deltaproteobacteria bacterium]|nr:M20/M25/M40 family metallo-hydrolase [Deltaproteobacteria bacterium]